MKKAILVFALLVVMSGSLNVHVQAAYDHYPASSLHSESYTEEEDGLYSLDGRKLYGNPEITKFCGDGFVGFTGYHDDETDTDYYVDITDVDVEDGNYKKGCVAWFYDTDTALGLGQHIFSIQNDEHVFVRLNTSSMQADLCVPVDMVENLVVKHCFRQGADGTFYLIGTYDGDDMYIKNDGYSAINLIAGWGVDEMTDIPIGSFTATIPIFEYDDTDAIQAYIENNDTSGAVNNDYLETQQEKTDDDIPVELPQELHVTGGYATGLETAYEINKDFDFAWNQTVDTSDYSFQIDILMEIGTVKKSGQGAAELTGDTYSSGWVSYTTGTYDGAKNIKYSIPPNKFNDDLLERCLNAHVNQTGEKIKYKGYLITKIKMRIRNIKGYQKSNYVVVTVDKDKVSTTAHVEDEDGEVVEDDQYDDTSVVDAQDGYDIGNTEIGFTGILEYIRTGFGMFGDYGIISLMSKCFLYLPASIWTMLNFLVAMMVAVSIVKLVKSFVFGG